MVLPFLLRRRRPPYAGATGATAGADDDPNQDEGFNILNDFFSGARAGATGSICTLSSFILARALVAVLVRSARRFLREPHLCTPRLFAVRPTETTREPKGHAYSKTDTLFVMRCNSYTEC